MNLNENLTIIIAVFIVWYLLFMVNQIFRKVNCLIAIHFYDEVNSNA